MHFSPPDLARCLLSRYRNFASGSVRRPASMSSDKRSSGLLDALLARSAYVGKPQANWPSIRDPRIEAGRRALGGHLALRPEFITDWLLENRKRAMQDAVGGDLFAAALLWKAVLGDGIFSGVLNLRCAGIATLPIKFRGRQEYVSQLQAGHRSVQSVHDALVPPDQKKLMIQDGIGMGVAVGELVPVVGRPYPVLRRLPPEGLFYRWASNIGSWHYRTASGGLLPITPGENGWVLWEFGGVDAAPWERGIWYPASRAFILKENAALCSGNLERGMANPAIVTTAPIGSSQEQRESWFGAFGNWAVNFLASAPAPGFDAKVLEVGNEASQIFDRSINRWNSELTICAAGQEVTTTGGSGFVNGDMWQTIRKEFIKEPADSWAYCENTQIIPQGWTLPVCGEAALNDSPCVSFDTRGPQEMTNLAQSWIQLAAALEKIEPVLHRHGMAIEFRDIVAEWGIPISEDAALSGAMRLDLDQLERVIKLAKDNGLRVEAEDIQAVIQQFSGMRISEIPQAENMTQLELAPTDVAKAVKVDEVRVSKGLPRLGGSLGETMIADLDNGGTVQKPGAPKLSAIAGGAA